MSFDRQVNGNLFQANSTLSATYRPVNYSIYSSKVEKQTLNHPLSMISSIFTIPEATKASDTQSPVSKATAQTLNGQTRKRRMKSLT